jgi:hypothetical protein
MQRIYIFSLFLLTAFAAKAQESPWISLFNGKDLTGWQVVAGKAEYKVVNGEIHGIGVPNTPNTFLRTVEEYDDFILEAEFIIDLGINSGLHVRSHQRPNGNVYGYQMEIDHNPERSWSGGIQDEARRAWLYPLTLNKPAQKAYKPGKWNKYKIECVGPIIKTYVNGILTAHLLDDADSKGFIAIQVHSLYNPQGEGKKSRWKNIRLKKLGKSSVPTATKERIYVVNNLPNQISDDEKGDGWRLLWDGKTSKGWRGVSTNAFPEDKWSMQDNALTIKAGEGGLGKDIITEEKFGLGFEFKFEFLYTEGANSGVKYFVEEALSKGGSSGIGLEYQILDDAVHPDAKMGVVGNRTISSLYDLIPSTKSGWVPGRPNQWNIGRIVAYPDGRIEHYLNNQLAVKYQRGDKIYEALIARSKYADILGFGLVNEGHLLLQDHGNKVSYRNLKIRKIK